MKQKNFVYTGSDNLEVMSGAAKYNDFLISQVKRAYEKIDKKNIKVLDFGAGSGTYTTLLKNEGILADCLEPDKKLQLILKKKGFKVHSSIKDIKTKYDLVFSLNVMERIEDDIKSLKEQYSILNNNGLIFVYVPAFQSLYSSMDRKVEHFRRYRKKEMVTKLKAAGFEIIESKYCDPIGFFASLGYKLVGNKDGDLDPKAIKIYDTFIFPISKRLEIGSRKVIGKNVLVIGRK